MKYQASRIVSTIVVLLLGLSVSISQAQSPQQTLNQYISDLQKNPNDYALREKIIRHVQTMKPAPAVPREAERFMNRGAAAAKSAKDANDFKDAVAEFEKATLSAPWMANAYYNLGVAQDKAGMYSSAIRSLKLYLIAAPNAPDAKNVEKLIDEIEYRQEKAAKEPSRLAVAVPQQTAFEDLLKKISGRRYFYPIPGQNGYAKTLDVSGQYLLLGLIVPPGHKHRNDPGGFISYANRPDGRYEIGGRETTVRIPYSTPPQQYTKEWAVDVTYIISENGDRITERSLFNTGKVGNELIFVWRQGLSQ
jgi:tetratricopeptide (TPR) repeat protein